MALGDRLGDHLLAQLFLRSHPIQDLLISHGSYIYRIQKYNKKSHHLHLYLNACDFVAEDRAPFAYVSYEHYRPFLHGYLGDRVVG